MIQHRSDPWGTNFFVDVHASEENDRLYIVSIISAGSDRVFLSDFEYRNIDEFWRPVMVGEMGKEDWVMRIQAPQK